MNGRYDNSVTILGDIATGERWLQSTVTRLQPPPRRGELVAVLALVNGCAAIPAVTAAREVARHGRAYVLASTPTGWKLAPWPAVTWEAAGTALRAMSRRTPTPTVREEDTRPVPLKKGRGTVTSGPTDSPTAVSTPTQPHPRPSPSRTATGRRTTSILTRLRAAGPDGATVADLAATINRSSSAARKLVRALTATGQVRRLSEHGAVILAEFAGMDAQPTAWAVSMARHDALAASTERRTTAMLTRLRTTGSVGSTIAELATEYERCEGHTSRIIHRMVAAGTVRRLSPHGPVVLVETPAPQPGPR